MSRGKWWKEYFHTYVRLPPFERTTDRRRTFEWRQMYVRVKAVQKRSEANLLVLRGQTLGGMGAKCLMLEVKEPEE